MKCDSLHFIVNAPLELTLLICKLDMSLLESHSWNIIPGISLLTCLLLFHIAHLWLSNDSVMLGWMESFIQEILIDTSPYF